MEDHHDNASCTEVEQDKLSAVIRLPSVKCSNT